MSHPESCHDSDCTLTYRQHLLDVTVSATAQPTRHPEVASKNTTEKRWDRDHQAFRDLTRQGYDVPHIDGSAARVRHAKTDMDIEHGTVRVDYSDPT